MTEFCPALWPEEPTPEHLKSCGESFFKDPNAEVKALRGAIHEVNGFQTVVGYHALAIRRRPNLWKLFIEDWTFFVHQFHH